MVAIVGFLLGNFRGNLMKMPIYNATYIPERLPRFHLLFSEITSMFPFNIL